MTGDSIIYVYVILILIHTDYITKWVQILMKVVPPNTLSTEEVSGEKCTNNAVKTFVPTIKSMDEGSWISISETI